LISGTPTTPGTTPVTLTATNAGGTGTETLTLTINPPPPVITSPSTASGTVGSAFSYQITATNNPTSYGAAPVPGGLSFNTATGLISGTPTTPGTTPVTLTATNAGGTGTETLTLTINSTSSFVQAVASASPGAAKSLSLSFPANTVAGDLILVAFDFDTTTTPSSVTDSQGNVFAEVGNQLTSPGGTRSRVYYAKSIQGGADTVTVNLSANSAWIELYLTEYSGMDPVNPIDAQTGASGNAGAVSSGNATTTVVGDVIFGYCVGDWTCSAGSGFAARSTFNGNLVEDMLAGNPGSYAAKGSANNGWSMQMVALKPAIH
jgi:PKD repeat protein